MPVSLNTVVEESHLISRKVLESLIGYKEVNSETESVIDKSLKDFYI